MAFFRVRRILCSIIVICRASAAIDIDLPPSQLSDSLPVEAPKAQKDNVVADAVNQTLTLPWIRAFDAAWHIRMLTNTPIDALNADSFDGTANSTWFTNRIGNRAIPDSKIAVAATTGLPPDTANSWTILKAKPGGTVRGFEIRDCRNNSYIIKLAFPHYPELATGSEMIGSTILHAAGYNVPRNFITEVDPARINVAPNIDYIDSIGNKRVFTYADIQKIMKGAKLSPAGRVRVLASRIIDGVNLGGWSTWGTRVDDPNDRIPHERRRELRGLRVIAGWINHSDFNIRNRLDMYDTTGRFVRHYLVDFSNTLGVGALGYKMPSEAHESFFNFARFMTNVVSLGFYVPKWQRYTSIPYESVGLWEAETFKPQQYTPMVRARIFEDMTDRDAYWGAKIVMSFSDSDIDTVVKTAQYSNPRAENYVARVLKERRNIIGRYYFEKISPLENFSLVRVFPVKYRIDFTDLVVHYRLHAPSQRLYRYCFSPCAGKRHYSYTKTNYIEFNPDSMMITPEGWSILHVQSNQGGGKGWSKHADVYLRTDTATRLITIKGLVHSPQ